MYGVLKDLLLNLLFLLFFLVFIPLLLEQSNIQRRYKKIIFSISACLAIISCISFPLVVNEESIYDLRVISTIIGSLYGGYVTAIFLWLTNIIFRSFFGGIGVYSTVIIATILLILLIYLYPKYQRYPKKEKMFVTMSLAFFSITAITILVSLVDKFPVDLYVSAMTMFIAVISTLVIVYIKELIKETAIIKKEAMKSEKMAIVSQLASSISHEIRNPLTVVKGFLQLMQNTELSRNKQLEYLDLSINELDKANNIIGGYLSFAKPNNENKENLNIKYELETIIDLITPLANMHSVTIEANLNSLWFRGDKQLFQQCMINITKNCIEAMTDGGVLTISTIPSNKRITVEITDTGVGMTEEELSRIGEPYFTTKGEKGTGLGMLTSINIIESMNGTFYIESEKDKGTTFTITFPIVQMEQKL